MSLLYCSPQTLSDIANAYGKNLYVTDVTVTHEYTGVMTVDVRLRAATTDGGLTMRSGWIPCEVAVPDTDDDVLVSRGGDVGVGAYWGFSEGWSISPPPTHWRPMPEPAECET